AGEGLPVHGQEQEHGHEHGHGSEGGKLVLALRSSMRDFLDTAFYFTIGVLITAVFNTQVPQSLIYPLAENEWLGAGSLMVLAFVLSLCSTSDAFIAAQLPAFSYASKLAFLVYGPMMDVKLVFMYSSVFRKRFVVVLALGLFILVGLICVRWGVVGAFFG
ncbi:MAG: permease, partial [Verrucomicrobiales bacterium]